MSRDYLPMISNEDVWGILDELVGQQQLRLEAGIQVPVWEHGFSKALAEMTTLLSDVKVFEVKKEHLESD